VSCTQYGVNCTQYGVNCTQYGVSRTQYGVNCTQVDVNCTQYDVNCTHYGVKLAQYGVKHLFHADTNMVAAVAKQREELSVGPTASEATASHVTPITEPREKGPSGILVYRTRCGCRLREFE
jgi:hypothetical protein